MARLAEKLEEAEKGSEDTQTTASSDNRGHEQDSPHEHPSSDGRPPNHNELIDLTNSDSEESQEGGLPTPTAQSRKRSIDQFNEVEDSATESACDDSHLVDSQTSAISERALEVRRAAFNTMIENARDQEWRPIGLVSTWDHHTEEEKEL